MNLVFDILSSIVVAALAAVMGVAVGLGVGIASAKLGDLDGPPGGVALISSAGLFGLLFGISAFLVSLRRYINRRTTQTGQAGFPD
jgi:hypothetical protein